MYKCGSKPFKQDDFPNRVWQSLQILSKMTKWSDQDSFTLWLEHLITCTLPRFLVQCRDLKCESLCGQNKIQSAKPYMFGFKLSISYGIDSNLWTWPKKQQPRWKRRLSFWTHRYGSSHGYRWGSSETSFKSQIQKSPLVDGDDHPSPAKRWYDKDFERSAEGDA